MLTIAGRPTSTRDFCDGVSRRDILRIGSLAALGTAGAWSLPDLLRAESLSGRKSPKSLYSNELVTFEDDRGAYDQKDAAGFIRLNALRLRTLAARKRSTEK